MIPDILLQAVMVLVPMILSLTVHEFAHAWSAWRLGDDTASRMGRMNLNPLSHIDPIGTLLLPILLLSSGSFGFFGWAKPVPVNPVRFTRKVSMRTGMMITAAAGPISNLLLAVIVVAVWSILRHSDVMLPRSAGKFLAMMLNINIALAVFNMFPFYPLDGQKVLSGLLPTQAAMNFERFNARYGMYAMLALFIFGRELIFIPMAWIYHGLTGIFGLYS